MKKLSRKILIFGITLLFIGTAIGTSIETKTNTLSSEPIKIQVLTNGYPVEIRYTINSFNKIPVKIDDKEYLRILINKESNILVKGEPDLPNICRSIIIPDTAQMKIKVKSYLYKDYENILVAPSKGNLPRTVNPDDLPYEFGEIYNTDCWYPRNIAELEQPYILRDFRGQVVKIYPFQYNPVKKTLRFYYDITVEVYQDGNNDINSIYRNNLPAKIQTDFKQIYERHFINFNKLGRYTPVEEQGNMLIVTYDNFWDNMVPFVEWKNMKGIPTEMVKVSEIGNANAIKQYIKDYYNSTGLTFVLLVGDAAQVPTLYAGGSASDPSYSYIVGNDHYPDLFVGRFSAENTQQVDTQVERTIEYERDPQIDAEWYKKGVGIASSQGPGDDNEMDYQHIRNIRTLLLKFTYTFVDELYDGSQGGGDAPGNPTPAMVATAVNDGRSIINYCGHGSPTSWGTSGFSNTDVNALTNDNMLPFITSVACNNGQFDSYTCFAEAWMRATHNGEPTGSIANFMSSKSQSWDPPMEAQDEFINLLVGIPDNKKTTFGALCFNGCMSMNDKYGSSGWAETDAWTVFGDPSVQVRTDTPADMSVLHDSEIKQETTTFEITVTDVEGALCAISRNYELLGYAYTDSTGYAMIEFDQPITGEEPLDLVVTAFNKINYMAQITVITNTPPNTPQRPTGPANGKTGVQYTYTTSTTDPDENQVFYKWYWGDGNFSDWIGPYNSSETATATHTWSEKGTYQIKVKARDTYGEESDWSEPLAVTMPLDHQSNENMILKILRIKQNIS
ncbi:MAG: C25 family cysteine peptidase [Candidatus Thermoplasmatota archaeon]|jgi:hypothetical protein|nr:C25 family cysteine peptidase [Candidatus Thermoplasmatota archaeon]